MARRTEQSLRSKRPDAAQAPPDRRLGGVHHLLHAFSEGYREDALASLLQPGAQHPNLTSKLQLLLRVIAQQDIRHVMVRAQRRSRVFTHLPLTWTITIADNASTDGTWMVTW